VSAPAPDSWVLIGVLGKPKGLRGEIWFRAYNLDGDALREGAMLHLMLRDKSARDVRVQRMGSQKEGALLAFEGIAHRDQAEALVGATVSVRRSDLLPLEDGEYYHCDMPGVRVVDAQQREIGTVVRVEAYPTVDSLVVATADGEREFPIAEGVVLQLDMVNRVVVIDINALEE
jgi:16S rRNA processing protein RimM